MTQPCSLVMVTAPLPTPPRPMYPPLPDLRAELSLPGLPAPPPQSSWVCSDLTILETPQHTHLFKLQLPWGSLPVLFSCFISSLSHFSLCVFYLTVLFTSAFPIRL